MGQKLIISPLNWGLGHATRCIPVIRSFLEKNWEVIIASDGDALDLLKKEFPKLPNYELPDYDISYPYRFAFGNMITNLRSFSRGAYDEYKTVKEIYDQEKPDLIISDNRYGVRHKSCKSIFIGHQLHLNAGNPLFSYFGSRINQKLIREFDELWIPDYEGDQSLAGKLSRPIKGISYQYIGPLSRLEKMKEPVQYDLCAIISGPEPQRARFQEILLEQLPKLDENSAIVLGKLDKQEDFIMNDTTRVISHMTSEGLNSLINRSKIVIARSGYSTIMDLTKLGKQAILVPTPGQTEQIYLAQHLSKKRNFVVQKQHKLNIPDALAELEKKTKKTMETGPFDVERFLDL